MPANINFTTFTDPLVAWASREALNTFFEGITVSDATSVVAGVVKQSSNIAAATLPATTYVSLNILDELGQVSVVQVASKASYDALKTAMATLLANMKTSGQMVGD